MKITLHPAAFKGDPQMMYTVKDVADMVGLTPRQIRNHIANGNLKATSFFVTHKCSMYIILKGDLDQWLLTR